MSNPACQTRRIMNLPFAIERLRDVLRRQHKSLSTEASYVYWLRHYVTALKTMAGERRNGTKLEPNESCQIGNKRTQTTAGPSCGKGFRFHQPHAFPRLLVFSKRIRHIMTQGDPICLLQQILHGRPEK